MVTKTERRAELAEDALMLAEYALEAERAKTASAVKRAKKKAEELETARKRILDLSRDYSLACDRSERLDQAVQQRDEAENYSIKALERALSYADKLVGAQPSRVITCAHEALKLAQEGLGHFNRRGGSIAPPQRFLERISEVLGTLDLPDTPLRQINKGLEDEIERLEKMLKVSRSNLESTAKESAAHREEASALRIECARLREERNAERVELVSWRALADSRNRPEEEAARAALETPPDPSVPPTADPNQRDNR